MRIESQVEIEVTAAEAFDLLSDFAQNPAWQQGMKSCVWTSQGPIGAGSTYDQVATFLGKPILTSFEVTAFEPGRTISIESRQSTFPIRVTRSVEPVSETRCRVRADVAGEPTGLMALMGPLMTWMVKRSVDADYQRLKALLEA